MGIHDRDWYQDWWAEKNGITPRKNPPPLSSAPPIRPSAPRGSTGWPRTIYRVVTGLLALFGALTLAKKYLLPLL